MMGLMMDAFGWSADQYWAATMHEVWSVIEARKRANDHLVT
jgi:hypothetical protein